MSRLSSQVAFTLTALLCVLPQQAAAHPHVWVDMRTSLVLNGEGLIEGMKVEWTFDEGYTSTATEGLDTNGDGSFSSEELAPLTQENIASLKEYNYFTVIRQNGNDLPQKDVTEFGQIFSNGRLQLYFKVPLASPADPRAGAVVARVYDPEYFIDFTYVDDDPVDVEGQLPAQCRMELKPLLTDAELDQTREMLSTKGADWKPDTPEDFGSMFARPLEVTCAS